MADGIGTIDFGGTSYRIEVWGDALVGFWWAAFRGATRLECYDGMVYDTIIAAFAAANTACFADYRLAVA